MSFFSVESHAVAGHAGTLEEAEGNFRTHGTEFQQAMDDLLGRIEGGAKAELQNLSTQWQDANRQVSDALRELHSRVDSTAKQYDSGAQDQADQVRSKGSGLNFHAAGNAL